MSRKAKGEQRLPSIDRARAQGHHGGRGFGAKGQLTTARNQRQWAFTARELYRRRRRHARKQGTLQPSGQVAEKDVRGPWVCPQPNRANQELPSGKENDVVYPSPVFVRHPVQGDRK